MLEKLFVFGLVTVVICTGLLIFLETGAMAAVIFAILIALIIVLLADGKVW